MKNITRQHRVVASATNTPLNGGGGGGKGHPIR